jgi:hypothetical protein
MYIEDWLRKNPGKSFSDAYAAFKAAGMPAQAARGQMTWPQAVDDARAEMKDPILWAGQEAVLAKKENRAPRTYQQALMDRAKELMQGATGAPAPTGGPVVVTAPNGQRFSFPTQEAANQFKQAAGIR